MASPFAAHGQFRTWVEGRVIFSEVLGPWNRELVHECVRELDAHARLLAPDGPHVGVAVVRGSMLCPPDAFAALRQAIVYSATRLHCIGNALVAAPDVEGRALVWPMYERMYAGVSEYRLADDIDSARAWALALLARQRPGDAAG